MRNRGSPFDQIILYLVAGVVVIGFIAFGAYDVLGGAPRQASRTILSLAPRPPPSLRAQVPVRLLLLYKPP